METEKSSLGAAPVGGQLWGDRGILDPEHVGGSRAMPVCRSAWDWAPGRGGLCCADLVPPDQTPLDLASL